MENKLSNNNNNVLGDHLLNQIFFDKYKLVKKLGEGSFGMIFKAESPEGRCAFKFEKKRPNKRTLLKNEFQIMSYLKGKRIPFIKSFGFSGEYNVLVMELMGKSLENIFENLPTKKMSVNCVAKLGSQMIEILEFIHNKHIIHRDIKPDNFVMGREEKSKYVYLLDFGLAKKYRSSKTKVQNPMIKHAKLTGTARYASINALDGWEQSRRDDLESFGYVLAYLYKGGLPWMGIHAKTKEEKYSKILDIKRNMETEQLLKQGPQELIDYLNYCKSLYYEEEPDYDYLTRLFKDLIIKNLKENIDYKFDWVSQEQALNHIKILGIFSENSSIYSNIITTSEDISNVKNEIKNIDKEHINKKKENEKLSYYDEAIDEIILIKKENNKKEEHEDKNEKMIIKEKKHGQCCIII